MKNVQITNLSPLPESELIEKSMEWQRNILALAYGIPASDLHSQETLHGPSLLERIKEAYRLVEELKAVNASH